ncbi:MAG: hypothetical protein H0Z29_02480 [Candidatus Marinimicrobia bacterium]|nr:hypothetical protein [Candidatus Neomarinimicrobiota bacterium]
MGKKASLLLIIALFFYGICIGQVSKDNTPLATAIYWKLLDRDSKKAFLYAYLYRTHEVYRQIEAKDSKGDCLIFYREFISYPLYEIYTTFKDNTKDEMIKYIDKFYKMEFNYSEPFYKAIEYACEMVKVGDKTLKELVEYYIQKQSR